ncbi:uncharacterized protein Z518_10305 [Rhinocladiella mackenziei CBS 650.93]|uniref:Uncharacterized protein n=1 Tax=Rhinocladiella mackenziei CBS 650.93 TaxID=1442369 RepID=A0A0D2GP89_9EURO|nr:uncharacterized protein Z518_10305 [Rhinocladiella mackenziei CBS 650.93]KIX00168.1 hypothetical protein Z518_10305 [Rhinocladiella mackenziei CBS 650.93]
MASVDPGDPIVVRRSKRPCSTISPAKSAEPTSFQASTPSKKRPQKRARFSDSTLVNGTTGLTPHVGKASLKTPDPRRASTPAPTRFKDHDEIQFTPFRECLEPRTIRRMRRHGLSEEMNRFEAEKKAEANAIIELKRQIKSLEAEIERLKDQLDSTVWDSLRIKQLEAELEELRQRLPSDNEETVPSEGDDAFQIYEDDGVANDYPLADGHDAVAMGLELESARQAKHALFRSSQNSSNSIINFGDSPVRPAAMAKSVPSTPDTFHHDLSKQFKAATNRAENAEVALQALAMEICGLGFPGNDDDALECISNIKNHFREMRLELERVMPGETAGSFDHTKLMPEMIAKLKMISERVRAREAELKSMRDQQRCLKGNFEHAIVAAEKANSRIKELEDTVDKNAEEMLEQRMRAQALERELRERESNHQSLITAIEKYREEVKRLEQLVQLIESEQASRIQDVRTATISEFRQQISDMDAKIAAETRGRRAAEESAVERLRKINDLESALSSARQQSEDVKSLLKSLENQLAESAHSHEEEVGGLNSRISGLSTALAATNVKIDSLAKANARLEERYRNEVEQGAETLERIQNENIRSAAKVNEMRKSYIRGAKVRLANWELESDELTSDDITPMTPVSIVRFSDVEGTDIHVEGGVEMSRGKSRRRGFIPGLGIMKRGGRRYDSGIGMDSLSEADEDETSPDLMSPDLSSEADMGHDMDPSVDNTV